MITCEKCGAVLNDDMKFCITCGNKVSAAEAPSVTPIEEVAAPVEAVTPTTAEEVTPIAVTEFKPEEVSYVDAEPFTPAQEPETYAEPTTYVSPTPAESRIPVMPSEQTAPTFPAAPQAIYGTHAVAEKKEKNEPVIGIGGWIGTFVLMCVPLVNLIMIIIWACGKSKYKSKVNFARAGLIMFLILSILCVGALIVLLVAFRSEFDYIISWFTRSINNFSL